MNTTITAINDTTMNLDVRKNTKFLLENKGKVFRAVFIKKDGTERTMFFTIATNWNPLNGIETTRSGMKMVSTKVGRNMATVTERLADGTFQPRTLPLDRIVSLTIA